MASTATEIKNLINSHLRRSMFGMEIYGQHEHNIFDGKENRTLVLEVRGANRFMRHGVVTVYHPLFGKWQASLLSEHHCGKPVQTMTVEEIRKNISRIPSQDFIYKVYGGSRPDTTIEQAQSDLIQEAVERGLFGRVGQP